MLAVALGMVFGIAHLLGGTDTEPAAESARVVGARAVGADGASNPVSTADAKPRKDAKQRHTGKSAKARKTETPLAEPSGPCEASDVVVDPKVKGVPYAGNRVTFRLKLTTLETPACTWRVAPSTLAIKLVSGSDRIWSSQDCPAAVPTTEVVVRKDHPAKVDVHWRGQRSDSACSRTTPWALPGWYHVQAAAFGAEPVDEQFELLPPVPVTITPTPKPEKKKHDDASDKKSDEPSSKPSDEPSGKPSARKSSD